MGEYLNWIVLIGIGVVLWQLNRTQQKLIKLQYKHHSKTLDGKTKQNVGKIKERLNTVSRRLRDLEKQHQSLMFGFNLLVSRLDLLHSHTTTLVRRTDTLGEYNRQLRTHYHLLDKIQRDVLRFGRVNATVCTQFVSEQLQGAMSRVDLSKLTSFDVQHISELSAEMNFARIEIPKAIKGDVGELYVENLIRKFFPQNSLERTATLQSFPDLEFTTQSGKLICIEVKDHHIEVDCPNRSKFEEYVSRDRYTGGILVNVGQGGIVGCSTELEFCQIAGKPVFLVGKSNYDLSRLLKMVMVLNHIL